MTIRSRLEAQFKRVPEGWLFTTANPWVLGPRRTYLLSDAQKPALAAQVRRSESIRLLLLIPIVLLIFAAAFMLPSFSDGSSVQVWLLWGVLFVVLPTGAIAVSNYLTVRQLLRAVPRSSQKIGLIELMWRHGETKSVTNLAISTLIFGIGTAYQTYEALTSARLGELAFAIAFASLAFAFGAMLVAKLRAPSSNETNDVVSE